MLNKKFLISILIVLGIVVLFFFVSKNNTTQKNPQTQDNNITQAPQSSEFATIVSTNPSPLDGAIVLPTQTIDITFSDPIVNTDELKHSMDPEGGYTLKLSFDRKTLSIIPNPSFKLGTGYIFTIKSDMTKFDNGKKLQSDINYHFNTIEYHGV